jgi:hypothetical protein
MFGSEGLHAKMKRLPAENAVLAGSLPPISWLRGD